ncbi:hypothetical protein ABW19_dt0203076 [Dactylella cylindrospora]|nr:hypothetical protein ABW19_dt0203076 [Dactylella cylindrospora]
MQPPEGCLMMTTGTIIPSGIVGTAMTEIMNLKDGEEGETLLIPRVSVPGMTVTGMMVGIAALATACRLLTEDWNDHALPITIRTIHDPTAQPILAHLPPTLDTNEGRPRPAIMKDPADDITTIAMHRTTMMLLNEALTMASLHGTLC